MIAEQRYMRATVSPTTLRRLLKAIQEQQPAASPLSMQRECKLDSRRKGRAEPPECVPRRGAKVRSIVKPRSFSLLNKRKKEEGNRKVRGHILLLV